MTISISNVNHIRYRLCICEVFITVQLWIDQWLGNELQEFITVFWVMHVKWLQNGKVFIKTKSNYQYPLSKYSTQLKISFSFPFIFRVDVKRVKRLTAIIDNTFNSFRDSFFNNWKKYDRSTLGMDFRTK